MVRFELKKAFENDEAEMRVKELEGTSRFQDPEEGHGILPEENRRFSSTFKVLSNVQSNCRRAQG